MIKMLVIFLVSLPFSRKFYTLFLYYKNLKNKNIHKNKSLLKMRSTKSNYKAPRNTTTICCRTCLIFFSKNQVSSLSSILKSSLLYTCHKYIYLTKGDNECILTLLFFKRIILKADLISNHLKEKVNIFDYDPAFITGKELGLEVRCREREIFID